MYCIINIAIQYVIFKLRVINFCPINVVFENYSQSPAPGILPIELEKLTGNYLSYVFIMSSCFWEPVYSRYFGKFVLRYLEMMCAH
jgi:hypothetical protein